MLSLVVGLGPSFSSLGLRILGCVLAWQLYRGGDPRHSMRAGALALGGIMIWLT